MMSAQRRPSRPAPGSTQAQSTRYRAMQVVTTIVLAAGFALVGATAAMAGPGCPDKPGVCGPGLLR